MKNNNDNCHYLPVAAKIHYDISENILKKHSGFLSKINGKRIKVNEITDSEPTLIFVLTGGTENQTINLTKKIVKIQQNSILLIAHSSNNSLPAALETLAKLKQDNIKGKIVYVSSVDDKKAIMEIKNFTSNYYVTKKLDTAKIGLMGKPSQWLVASMPCPKTVEKVWGPKISNLNLETLYDEYDKINTKKAEIFLHNNSFLTSKASVSRKQEFVKAIKLYIALQTVITNNNLDAISIRCFDLIMKKNITACLSLALLNKEGIISGCEGDLVSAVGMLWIYYLLNKKSWMANPSRINQENNTLLLAHCTISCDIVRECSYPTHFESGIGIGVKGIVPIQSVTLFRIGGKNLNKLWIAQGKIIENTNFNNLCRTQIMVKLDENEKTKELLVDPLGNHLVVIPGKHRAKILDSWQFVQNN